MVPVTAQAVPWLEDPKRAAEIEAYSLLSVLKTLDKETKKVRKEFGRKATRLGRARRSLAAEKARLAKMRAVLSAGMSDYAGIDVQMEGMFSSARKGLKKAVGKVEKSVIRPVMAPIKRPLKKFEKEVIRPAAEFAIKEPSRQVKKHAWTPVREVAHKLEKYTIRPGAKPIKRPLKKFERYTLRPGAKHARKGIVILDKYVPGWTTLLDFVVPIPIGTIIGKLGLLMKTSGNLIVKHATTQVTKEVYGQASAHLWNNAMKLAARTTMEVGKSVQVVGGSQIVKIPLTVSKGTDTYLRTEGPLLDKITAVGIEALQGFTLVAQVAAALVSGGASVAAAQALNVAVKALKAGISVLKTYQAARVLKKQAKLISRAAAAEIARIEAEHKKTMAEIAELERQIEEMKKATAAIKMPVMTPLPIAMPVPTPQPVPVAQPRRPSSAVGAIARRLDVSPMVVVAGGAMLVGGVVLIAVAAASVGDEA